VQYQYAIYVIPYKVFLCCFTFLCQEQYGNTIELQKNPKQQGCMCVTNSSKTDLHLIVTYKIIIKTISCCYILRMLIQEYAKNLAKQSKLQRFLLEIEQHNLLLIVTACTIMQLKNVLSKENNAAGCMT